MKSNLLYSKVAVVLSLTLLFAGVIFAEGFILGELDANSPQPQIMKPRRTVTFGGYDWHVKHGDLLGPGPNYFSDSNDSIWVDKDGHLHMTIIKRADKWFCTEIINSKSLGYGSYIFTIKSRVDKLDQNTILGMFTWDSYAPEHNYREIDFEFGKWQKPGNKNSQFVIQPWNTEGNTYRYDIKYDIFTETTTHIMTWTPKGIYFKSYYGQYSKNPSVKNMIQTWEYTGKDNPPPGGENIRINLWLVWGEYPTDGKNVEVVIEDFKYIPKLTSVSIDINNKSRVDLHDLALFAANWITAG